MFETRSYSHLSRVSAAVLQVTLVLLLVANPAQAITVACAKTTAATLLHNGIVAPGAAGPCGAVGPVWPTVAPLEMVPNGSTPDGYLYLAYNPNVNGAQRLFIGVDSSGDPDVSNNDDIVIVFHSTSSPDFATGDFYVRVPVIASNADINTGVNCLQPAGAIDYYTFVQGTGWQQVTDPAVAAAIDAHAAYRYDMNNKVWNLEIDMPISVTINGTKYFDLPATVDPDPTKRVFALGAYYFISQGNPPVGLNPKPLKWPDTMPDRQSYNDQLMQSLATPLTANQLGNISLSNVCFDVNFNVATPWDIGGVAANEFDHKVVRSAVNTFGATFLYSGPGTTTGNLPNTGIVSLSLVPYGTYSTQPHVPWTAPAQTVTLPNFNTTKRVTFDYDFSNMPANWAPFQPLNFVCATTTLSGFTHDDNTTNNSINVNYNYFTTSDYTHHFSVAGDDVANLKPGETGSMFLRLESTNEVTSSHDMIALAWPATGTWRWLIPALLTIILSACALVLTALRRRLPPRLLASGVTVVLVAMSVLAYAGCRKPHMPKTRWEVQNARKLGLKPVKGYPNLYQMPIKRGEFTQVDLRFIGERLPYTPVRQKLTPATSDGQPNIVRVAVKPGRVITVLGFGNIRLDGPNGRLAPASPMGIIVGEAEPLAATRSGYLLQSTYYSSNEYAGALIGSFDNFETSFVVGRSSSILVPPEAGTLSLAVNAVRGQYARIVGDYDLVIIDTEGPQVPTHTAIRGDATGHVPVMFPIWKVLTSLEVHSYFETHGVNPVGNPYRTLNPIGAAYYSIYETHVQ